MQVKRGAPMKQEELIAAMEWGFTAHKRGKNLERAREDFKHVLAGDVFCLGCGKYHGWHGAKIECPLEDYDLVGGAE